MTAIEISVSYTLSEYLSIVGDHLPAVLARTGSGKRRQPGRFTRALVLGAASVSFFLKKRRMPVCDFLIDEEHVRRRTQLGELVWAWPDVVVHRYSQGFLLEKGGSSMPLPYRCFSAQQAAAFDVLAAKRRA